MSSPTNKYQGWTTIWSPWPFPLYHQPRLIKKKEMREAEDFSKWIKGSWRQDIPQGFIEIDPEKFSIEIPNPWNSISITFSDNDESD